MSVDWIRHESGPGDAERTVLLLPGGLNAARSYAELMAQPMLSQVHLIAVTLPGHAGTRPPEDFSIEGYARHASKLAADLGCDAVLGFSVGATIALEMVSSGQFSGPVVLLGVSLSPRDESGFLRVLDRLAAVLGPLPFALMRKLMPLAVRHARVTADRRVELLADLCRSDPEVMREIFRGYLSYLARHDAPAPRLCKAGEPVWVVHAEQGDGGLTKKERRTLNRCPHTTVITLPGTSYFIPNEEPESVAGYLAEALDQAG